MQPDAHTPNRANWLRNGNRPGNPLGSPRCGAMTRCGTPCRAPGVHKRDGIYGRCRLHGGCSTGPKTPEGRERARMANYKGGSYSDETRRFYRAYRLKMKQVLAFLRTIERNRERWNRRLEGRQHWDEPLHVLAEIFRNDRPT